ncbi:MAG: WD40 repeat domain-containing protein [Planctomycetales bacterium]|nr:WD40 repeat domain-containing protein [Planctomycetales bacterium]
MGTRSIRGGHILGVLTAIGMLVESSVGQEPPGVVGRFGTLEYRTAGWCSTAALSPDGKVLAVAGSHTIGLTDLTNGKQIGQFAEGDATLLSFLDQGKTLVSVNSKGMVRYWSLEKGGESRQAWQAFLPEHNPDSNAVLSPSGNLLLALDENHVNIWDLNQQKRLRQFKTPTDSGPFALAPDGNAVGMLGKQGLVILDAASGKPKTTTDQFEGYRVGIRFSPDGKKLATCGGYDKYRVWDTETLREQFQVDERPNPEQHQMVVSPDGKLLATTHRNGFLRLWDLQSKKEIWNASLIREGFQKTLQSVFFSPDQQRIISAEHEIIRIWDAATGRELTAESRPQHVPVSLVASADGMTLSGNYGLTMRIWDVGTFKERFRANDVESHVGAEFSRTPGKLMYAHRDHSARVVDAASGRELARLTGHSSDVTGVAFAADDKEVLTVSDDGTLRAWDAETGKELRKHVLEIPDWYGKNPSDNRRYDTFSADGQMLITRYFWKDNFRMWHYSAKTGERNAERDSMRPLSEVCLAPNGRTFVGRGRGLTLDVFDMATDKVTLPLHAASKESPITLWFDQRVAAYSPDSRFLAVPTEKDDGIEIWDIAVRKKVHTISHKRKIEFTFVGNNEFTFVGNNFLATSANDTTVLLWDISHLRKQPEKVK